jgi:plastocyanin
MKSKRGWIAGLTVPLMIAIALQSAGSPAVKANAQQAAAKAAEVKIDNFSFAPGTFTVAVGTTATWTNHDDIPHTAVSADR